MFLSHGQVIVHLIVNILHLVLMTTKGTTFLLIYNFVGVFVYNHSTYNYIGYIHWLLGCTLHITLRFKNRYPGPFTFECLRQVYCPFLGVTTLLTIQLPKQKWWVTKASRPMFLLDSVLMRMINFFIYSCPEKTKLI